MEGWSSSLDLQAIAQVAGKWWAGETSLDKGGYLASNGVQLKSISIIISLVYFKVDKLKYSHNPPYMNNLFKVTDIVLFETPT